MSVNGLEITDVAIFPVKDKQSDSKVLAFGKITLNANFVIAGIKIVNGSKGAFVAFPQNYNAKTKKAFDLAFPITSEFREYAMSTILHKFKETQGDNQDPMNQDEFMSNVPDNSSYEDL